jgi:hypothetical protein
MVFINRHSFFVTGGLAVLAAFALAAIEGLTALWLGLVALVVIAFIVLFRWVGPGGGSHGKDRAVLDLIGNGKPVLLEFQSAY